MGKIKGLRKKELTRMLIQKRREFETKLFGAEEIHRRDLVDYATDRSSVKGDYGDCGDGICGISINGNSKCLIGIYEKELQQIEEAEQKVEEGTYGVCEKCREEIELRRLNVELSATLCCECKTIKETIAKNSIFHTRTSTYAV